MMGERLAQEAVGLSYLSGHDDWMEDLRSSAEPDRRDRRSGSPVAVLNLTPLPTDLEGGVDLLPNVFVLVSSLLARLRLLVGNVTRATTSASQGNAQHMFCYVRGRIGLPENSEGEMNPHGCDL